MAEETKPSTESNDDVIDLEGLVQNIDLTPTADIVAAKSGDESTTPHAPLHADALSHDEIDAILVEEDPSLATQMDEIRSVKIEPAKEGESAPLHDELPVGKKVSFRQWIGLQLLKVGAAFRGIRELIVLSVKDSKGVLRAVVARTKTALLATALNQKAKIGSVFKWILSRSLAQKTALLLALATVAGLGLVVSRTLKGTLLPKTEKVWVASFTEHADGAFTYSQNGSFEDFNDPLLHPEFVVLIERVVVNLARTPEASENSNPMAAVELYLQTDSQESAIEIKDRNVEVRDAIARSVERVTYPELADEDGKTKLKLLIRKELNEKLTRGKVRRVFFKTIVLNPE